MAGVMLRSMACGLLFLASTQVLAAPDPRTTADQLVAAFTATGEGTLTYDGATASGDAVVLSGVKLSTTDGTESTVPALVITGMADRAPGGFTAQRITFNDGTSIGHGDTITWQEATLENVIVPTAPETAAREHIRLFRTVSFTNLNLSGGDFPSPVDAATLTLAVGDISENAPASVTLQASGVRLPAGLVTNPVLGALVGMLNYKEFVANISMEAEYDGRADTVVCRSLILDVPGVGKVTMNGKASDFSLRELADRTKSKEARARARLDALTVRIDNAGFVERMLDMQAEMLGGTRDDVRVQLVEGALPFALSFVESESFRAQFLAAVSAFLNDPHSLTIVFEPPKPVPLGQALRTATRRPGALPDLLAPQVEANN